MEHETKEVISLVCLGHATLCGRKIVPGCMPTLHSPHRRRPGLQLNLHKYCAVRAEGSLGWSCVQAAKSGGTLGDQVRRKATLVNYLRVKVSWVCVGCGLWLGVWWLVCVSRQCEPVL